MISQDASSAPSDLKPYGVIEYDPKTREGAIQFTKEISEALRILFESPPKNASPVYEFLRVTHRYLESFYPVLIKPIAIMQCAKCNRIY